MMLSPVNALGYARGGREIEVMDALAAEGIYAWRGLVVDLVRRGKNRRAEPEERPALPNCLLMHLTPETWHLAHTVKHLSRWTQWLGPSLVAREVDPFRRRVDAAHAEAMRSIERGELVTRAEFIPGDEVKLIVGPFADMVSRFCRIVEDGERISYELELSLFGRVTSVHADPLDVRRA
jgi:transcription antitermination factor NusG